MAPLKFLQAKGWDEGGKRDLCLIAHEVLAVFIDKNDSDFLAVNKVEHSR